MPIRLRLFITLLIVWLSTISAVVQIEPTIEELEIAIWPEFDRQAALVLIRIQLAQDTQLPAVISLPIPSEVGEPHAVAWKDEAGELFLAEYTRQEDGEWAEITFQTEGIAAQLEYYQDINTSGSSKQYEFVWPGGFGANVLRYEVQQPAGASNLTVEPPSESTAVGAFDLNYFRADLGPLAADAEFVITVTYTKADDAISVDSISASPVFSTSVPVRPAGSTPDVAQILPLLLAVLGGGLLLFSGIMYFRYRRDQMATKSRVKRRGKKQEAEQQAIVNSLDVFCQNCGTQADSSDQYCRNCGTKLRR